MKGFLSLENGEVFTGQMFGASPPPKGGIVGEVVFQTGMVGYPESLTDPSYSNQILVLTYPLIGNYGVPDTEARDEYGLLRYVESERIHVKALVVGEYIDEPSHHQSTKTLSQYLREQEIPGLSGVDTRRLTELIREHGTFRGVIWISEQVVPPPLPKERYLAQQVAKKWDVLINPTGERKVLVVDCGIKHNQLRMLASRGCALFVMGVNRIGTITTLEGLVDQTGAKFLFISNGPGDPEDCAEFIEDLRVFMMGHPAFPIFGICLGHQLLALAAGHETVKMKYGNRGHNIPCRYRDTPRTVITTQNHGYAVEMAEGLAGWEPLFTNLNDGTNEGMIHTQNPWFSVQFHPEAKAGPEDSSFLFDWFLDPELQWNTSLASGCPTTNTTNHKVLILGSGGLQIGQAGEFDYSGSQAIKAYKEDGLTTILVNPNIATVQTSPGFVDKVYFLPVTPEYVTKIIEQERPDCISLSFGGQTALNCGAELENSGVLARYDVKVLGTPVEAILMTEDRDVFKKHIQSIGERIPDGVIANNVSDAIDSANQIGYPVLVRAAFALGGLGSGFANSCEELKELLQTSFSYSTQVIIDKSLRGWKEVEYEIVRDRYGNCISVCNMENFDPLGVHTGESIVVAPSQTLTDTEYHMLRSVALKTVNSLGIVGECNIQYAMDPHSKEYYIIEINARLSRSSALASKATGYPLAYVAAKLGLGYGLHELKNSITGTTSACFEPSLDYCVVKVPRWDLTKFERVNTHIGSAMKSVGEGMAIGRTFEEALQSALRMTGMNRYGLQSGVVECTQDELSNPTYRRVLAVATALRSDRTDYSKWLVHELSGIDGWFLDRIERIVKMQEWLERAPKIPRQANVTRLRNAKRLGFSDAGIGHYTGGTELAVRGWRHQDGLRPDVKKIDTVAAEFPCQTNYLYTTYSTNPTRAIPQQVDPKTVMVLGSGVYKIGSSVEFDWCAVSCIRELRKLGKRVVVVNCNPETVSTDYDEADVLYFTEISLETVLDIYQLERPGGVVVSVGGQLPNNIALDLHRLGIPVIGTSPENIDRAENRFHFSRMLRDLGINQPQWCDLTSVDDALEWCHTVGYPCLVRPSYVLSGAAMNVAYSDEDMRRFLGAAVEVSPDHPVVVSKFISGAKEIEVDAVAQHGEVKVMAVSEHVENAGVHSGDATVVFPAQDLTTITRQTVKMISSAIAKELLIHGPFNIQFIAAKDAVKVIECNLRVSRSFPFVSKTMGVNLVAQATRAWMEEPVDWNVGQSTARVGVKVPQFSFNRLTGADILLGVEMQSTGEVACFGKDKYEAYLKSVVASGFKLPKQGSNVLLSIGGHAFKKEFKPSAEKLIKLGYKLYGTRNTADYYRISEMRMTSTRTQENIMNWIAEKQFGLVINITERNKMRCVEDELTDGYRMRRAATESNVPIVTDIKVAKLLVRGLKQFHRREVGVRSDIDCFSAKTHVRIPGLIDVHVHVREPGETYKEDWTSCTQAALAGGITVICAMPNTNPPLVSKKTYKIVEELASQKAVCDYALFGGAASENIEGISRLSDELAGLKMYLNNTHGHLLLKNTMIWREHLKNWDHPTHPVCVHAEGQTLAAVLHLAEIYERRVHVCHISSQEEIILVREAKERGQPVTCEVAPHHLFMTYSEGAPLTHVKPCLQSERDRQALWDNMDIIDCFATDHAPHTLQDKTEHGCPGFPGLETALPLLLTAVHEGKLTLDDIVAKYHTNPKRIFGLPDQPDTYVEIDLNQHHTINAEGSWSRAGWTPFAGRKCVGAVKKVVLRGKTVFMADRKRQITVNPGFGENVRKWKAQHIVVEVARPSVLRVSPPSVSALLKRKSLIVPIPRHILSASQFTQDMLRMIFERTDEIRRDPTKWSQALAGKTVGLFFMEASTRTRVSFERAVKALGGEAIHVSGSGSSVKKGETLEDSVSCIQLSGQVDAIVLRQSEVGGAHRASEVPGMVPIINAGDGGGEHPTQTLLDLYTIRRELGTIGGLCVVLVGDLKYGRTVHSLVKALALRSNVRLHYVAPENLQMPSEVMEYVDECGVREQSRHSELSDELIGIADVIYMTRMQTERHHFLISSIDEVNNCITPAVLAKAKRKMIVMHPLPRGNEISTEIDSDPRAAYKRQMANGPYVRMALLTLIGTVKQ
jgi:carbamoyl-phosphate synthase/aspartate carbamoyltransferase/dihydroorotase